VRDHRRVEKVRILTACIACRKGQSGDISPLRVFLPRDDAIFSAFGRMLVTLGVSLGNPKTREGELAVIKERLATYEVTSIRVARGAPRPLPRPHPNIRFVKSFSSFIDRLLQHALDRVSRWPTLHRLNH